MNSFFDKNGLKLKNKFQAPSGASSPIFSLSPLPVRRNKLCFTDDTNNYKLSEDANYYPNCDVNVWLRSCEKEVIEPLQGFTKGNIPKWLNGCLLRNGPGSLKAGNDYFNHLFDSSALLHRFNIEDGEVTYQCRFVQSEVYKKNWNANRIVYTEFGTKAVADPCHSIFDRVAAIFHPASRQSDNTMISLYPFGDEIYAFGEIPAIHKINSETLDTEEKVDISKFVSIVHHTSHPHVMEDGTVFNLGLSVYPSGLYHTIVEFPRENYFEDAKIVASITPRWPFHPSYMHTFGVTENYFVIVEQPLSVSVAGMFMTKMKNEPMAGCFRWYQDQKTEICLISRKTGALAYKFYSEAFFYLHIINQYEIDNYLVLDICIYRDPSMLDCMYIETMKTMHKNPNYAKMFRSKPVRFVLPLKPNSGEKNLIKLPGTKAEAMFMKNGEILLKPEKLCNLGCETPRINYSKHLGRKYRYFYAISADVDAKNPGTIIKVDTQKKLAKTWCEDDCYPSEPIFVPNPHPKSEDDGVVLAAMVWGNGKTNKAGLIVLDGQTFEEVGRAEFETPGPVPKCLHGWFLPRNRDKDNNNYK